MAQVRVRKRDKIFSYIFEAGKVDGKRKVIEKGGYPTKAKAYKASVAAYNDFFHGNLIQSKKLPSPVGEKISLSCTRDDWRIFLRGIIINSLITEGFF